MILHDISRDALTTPVFEGDPPTEVRQLQSIDEMDVCNLTAVSMTTHAGTHIDAPLHFWEDGQSIDMLRLNTFYGKCTVIAVQGVLTGADMDRLLPYCKRRVLFRGNGKTFLSLSAAQVLADSKVTASWQGQESRCSKISTSPRSSRDTMTSARSRSSSRDSRRLPAARYSLKWKRDCDRR